MNTGHHLPIRYLPEGLRRIAEYSGWDVMWAIWEAYAGCRLFVPKSPEESHPLCALLGLRAAKAFCTAFGGNMLNIPKADAAKRAVRDKAIRAEKAIGVSMSDLCQKYKLTYRQIQSITREDAAMPAMNFDLFDS